MYDPLEYFEYHRWCNVDVLDISEGLLPVHGLCRPALSISVDDASGPPLLVAIPGRGGFWIHRWGNNPVAGPSMDSEVLESTVHRDVKLAAAFSGQ